MNRANRKLFGILLITAATVFAWTSWFDLPIAKAQNAVIPVPDVQQQPVELLTAENIPPEVKSAVFNDAVKRTSKTVSALKITEARSRSWSDGCLGLGQSDEICTQAIVPGWQITVTDGLKNWIYRTDEMGDTVRLER